VDLFEPFSLDQLRMLVTVIDLGNFSAAARHLGRVQSAVSHAMSNFESELGITLWDRSTRIPTLTPAGEAVALAARRVLAESARLRKIATSLRGGAEATVSVCFDQLFPTATTVALCRAFAERFGEVQLRVESETLGAVCERVRGGACDLGVAVVDFGATDLNGRHVLTLELVPVAHPDHPLGARQRSEGGALPSEILSRETQIVLSERSPDGVPDRGVIGLQTWRVADLHTKLELIRAGLGWGNLPRHLVSTDLDTGRLVRLRPERWPESGAGIHFSAVQRPDAALGPAATWLVDHLAELCKDPPGT